MERQLQVALGADTTKDGRFREKVIATIMSPLEKEGDNKPEAWQVETAWVVKEDDWEMSAWKACCDGGELTICHDR